MKVLYFSSTGNCIYVAKSLGSEALSIPELMKSGQLEIEDEIVGIVTPVYYGDLPQMVQKFIAKATIRTEYLFAIITYGSNPTSALKMAERRLRDAGLAPAYIGKVLMVDNYLDLFEIGAELEKKSPVEIDRQIGAVKADIENRKQQAVPSSLAVSIIGPAMRFYGRKRFAKPTAQSFTVSDDCIHCGICAKVCPADNITVDGGKPIFSDHCEICYACAHNCPKAAIHVPKEKSGLRFRNEHVKLAEIIAANNTGR